MQKNSIASICLFNGGDTRMNYFSFWQPSQEDLEKNRRSFAARLAKQWRQGKMDAPHREAVEFLDTIAVCGSYSRYLDSPSSESAAILRKYGLLEA